MHIQNLPGVVVLECSQNDIVSLTVNHCSKLFCLLCIVVRDIYIVPYCVVILCVLYQVLL